MEFAEAGSNPRLRGLVAQHLVARCCRRIRIVYCVRLGVVDHRESVQEKTLRKAVPDEIGFGSYASELLSLCLLVARLRLSLEVCCFFVAGSNSGTSQHAMAHSINNGICGGWCGSKGCQAEWADSVDVCSPKWPQSSGGQIDQGTDQSYLRENRC